jgi:multiple sugar transport system substrate-binding protein
MKKVFSMLLCLALLTALCTCAFAEPVEVNMWHYFDDTSETALSKQVEEYNASQDAIKVSLTYCSRQELYNQLSMGALSPDNLPEIAMIDNPDVAAFISMGILQDITDAAAEWGEVEKFYQGPLGACYADGRLYGLTNNTNCLTLVANMDMLAEAGYDAIPDTWDEFSKLVEACTKPDDGVYGFAMCARSDEEGTFQIIPWIVAGGANYDSMDSEGAIKALSLINTFAKNGWMSQECLNWTQGDAFNSFCAGKAATCMIGTWHLSQIDTLIADAGSNVKYQLFKIPGLESGMSGSCVGGECYSVTTAAAAKGVEKEVEDFLFYLMSADHAAYFCEVSGKFPPRSDTYDMIEKFTTDPAYLVMNDEMAFAQARGPVAEWAKISEALYTASQSMVLDTATPEDAAATAAAAIASVLG